ncbi:MAG: UDP-N-acetylmuramate dehydrogenase [Candidatus Omnitrophota bacterium]
MQINKKNLKFIRGEVRFDEPMSRHTTFKIGGPADVWIAPRDKEDLLSVLRFAKENLVNVFVFGGGSNVLVADKGIRGFTISLSGPAFRYAEFNDCKVRVGCGMRLAEFILEAADRDLGGCEFLAGVPGTIGGALVMNAGGALTSVGDFVCEATVIKDLTAINLTKERLNFSYRDSALKEFILIEAVLNMARRNKDDIIRQLRENLLRKNESQDLAYPSAGCIFTNHSPQLSSGKLIELSGFKGASAGSAVVSERHANFIVNRGGAKACDVLTLINEIQKKVFKEHGIMLKLEVKLAGEF